MQKTRVLHQSDIFQAVELIKQGGLVAFPTETVYGLGAPIFLRKSIQRIFDVKGRPSNNPLIAHISDLDQVLRIAKNPPEVFFKLADVFFPGPLTIIVEKREDVPDEASGGLSTIGIRMPDHPIALELIDALGVPLAAPSANLSGKPSSTCVEHVLQDFSGKIAAVIDGGPCCLGIESTVLLLSEQGPRILRPGFVTQEMLSEVLSIPVQIGSKEQGGYSPGTQFRHYSPQATVKLCYQTQPEQLKPHAKKQIILKEVSQSNLFASLRKADQEGYDEIVIICTPEMQADSALMDRLTRAAEKKD